MKTATAPEVESTDEDLYSILQISKTASVADLKKQYKRLAFVHHPDKNPGDDAAACKFQSISAAYNVLADAGKRKYYDVNGTIEDIDVSAEDWMASFAETMHELTQGIPIKDMLQGMTKEDLMNMPPFPFPSELFPAGTFPDGVKFSSDGLKGIPPSVQALLESPDTAALSRLFSQSTALPGHLPSKRSCKKKSKRVFTTHARTDAPKIPNFKHMEQLLGSLTPAQLQTFLQGTDPSQLADGPDQQYFLEMMESLVASAPHDESDGSSSGYISYDGLDNMDPSNIQYNTPPSPLRSQAPHPKEFSTCSDHLPASDNPKAPSPVSPQMQKAWFSASKAGWLREMDALLTSNPSLLHVQGPGLGNTALHWAAARGQQDIIDWLLLRPSIDVNMRNATLSTALHAAAANGQSSAVSSLLSHPLVDTSLCNEDGHTAAGVARLHSHLDLAHLLTCHPNTCDNSHPIIPETIYTQAVADTHHVSTSQSDSGAGHVPSVEVRRNPDMQAHRDEITHLKSLQNTANSSCSMEEAAQRGVNGAGVPSHLLDTTLVDDGPLRMQPESSTSAIDNHVHLSSLDEGLRKKELPASSPHHQSCSTVEDAAGRTLPTAYTEQFPDQCANTYPTVPQHIPSRGVLKDDERQLGVPEASSCVWAIEKARWTAAVSKQEGLEWMNASRSGDCAAMRALLNQNPCLLLYRGQGTKYGFTGHSALHWAAAEGHVEVTRWLLTLGLPIHAPNFAGCTPLQSAVNNKRNAMIELLILEGGGNALLYDDVGESARDSAVELYGHGSQEVQRMDLYTKVNSMRAMDPRSWATRDMKAVLAAAGKPLSGGLELQDVRNECSLYISSLPGKTSSCDLTPYLPPHYVLVPAQAGLGTDQTQEADVPVSSTEDESPPTPGPSIAAAQSKPAQSDDEESSDGSMIGTRARARGNSHFKDGEYQRAVYQYSIAVRFLGKDGSLFSNRSAAYAKLGKWDDALKDAEQAVKQDEKNPKFWCRKGAALLGLGQAGEGVKAYKKAGAVQPGYAGAQEGLQLAKQAINDAQQRYEERWGTSAE